MESLSKKIITIFSIFLILLFFSCQCSYATSETEQTNSTSDLENSAEELRNEGMNVEVTTTENEDGTTTVISINYEQKNYNSRTWMGKKIFDKSNGNFYKYSIRCYKGNSRCYTNVN